MAQKVNSTSLRIANKIVWDSVLSEDNKTHYLLILRSLEIKKYAILLFNFLNLKGSETMVKFQNGSANVNFKCLGKSSAKDKTLKILSSLKQYVLNTSQQTTSLNFKKFRSKKVGQKWISPEVTLWESKMLFHFVPSKFFSRLIVSQLKLTSKYRNEAFKFGIHIGIQSLLRYFYNKKTKIFVSGIKVICKGKWSKTASGRTQKIILNLGRLKNQTFIRSIRRNEKDT